MVKANLPGNDDELAFIQQPESKVYLLDENYHMTNVLPNKEDRDK